MYIIVVGGGRVGYYLARALLDEGHEVLIVEKNARFCEIINDELGGVCIHGDGSEAAILEEIGTSRADMFIAVTGDDEDNLIACQVAKYKFNVSRTISRVRNPQNEDLFKKLGVDVTVSSTSIILEHIEEKVPTHPLTHLFTLRDEKLEIVEIKVSPDAIAIGKSVNELSLPKESKLVLVVPKEGGPYVPSANTVLEAGDQIIALTSPESEEELRAALRGN